VNRYVNVLLVALVIQVGITATLFWSAAPRPNARAAVPMAAFGPAQVRVVRIGDEYDNEVELERSADNWLLPQLGELPADGPRVRALLDALTRPPASWPVAQSPAARQRFQVADYYYQRRVELYGRDGLLGTFYLGTSPGFRRVHARNDAQSAIYSIGFNTYDAPATSGGWLDPRLLQIRTPVALTGDGYSLYLEDGQWLSGIGEAVDAREVEALTGILRNLRVEGVAAEDVQRELSGEEAALVLRVNSLAGNITLEFFTLRDEHFVLSSEYPYFFRIPAYDYDQLAGIDQRLLSASSGLPQGNQPAHGSLR